MKRRHARGAPALDDPHAELEPGRLEEKAQACRGRFRRGGERTKNENGAAPGFRGDRQALQLDVAHFRQPGGEYMAAA